MAILLLISFLIVMLSIDAIIQYKRKNKEDVSVKNYFNTTDLLDEKKIIIPRGILFDKTHTWTHMKKYGNVRVGVNDFLQHIIGDITKVIMKNNNEYVKRNDLLLSIIQNGKKINLYSPVNGKIVCCNNNLLKNSNLINESPYEDGWIYEISPTNWEKDIKSMLMDKTAFEWIETEFVRFKDFLTNTQLKNKEELIILQDGGEIKDKILSNFGPEMWEEFQLNFINKNKL